MKWAYGLGAIGSLIFMGSLVVDRIQRRRAGEPV